MNITIGYDYTMKRYIIKTLMDTKKFFKHFNTDVFSFDTETTALKYMELDIEGISFCDGILSCYIDLIDNEDRKEILSFLNNIFSNVKVIIAHNILFDLKVLHKVGIIVKDTIKLYDTMIAAHLLDENNPVGLKYLAEEKLGKDITKYEEIKNHRSREFYMYACHDAEWTYELMRLQKPQLIDEDLKDLFTNIEMPFQWVLLDMELNGMLIDVDTLNETAKELLETITDLKFKLKQYTGDKDINFNSGQQLGNFLFKDLALPIIETTKTGRPSTGTLTINALKDKHPFVELLYQYKIVQKLYSAYFAKDAQILRNIDSDGRVRPSFRDTGTATGRLSCSEPNLQQLPKINKDMPIDTRKCFVAPKGSTMITCDYSGQELRVLTEITQEPVLIDTFNKGKDMHLATANDFFNLNIPEEALYEGSKEHGVYKDKYKAERNKAKIINFGMAYGKGAFGFSKDFNISEDEAQEILDKYFAALPKVREAIDRCHQEVRDNGFVATMAGRRRRFKLNQWGKMDNKSFRQAFNFLIQGFSADMIRIAMVRVRELGKQNKEWGLKTIATVHDEAVYECNEQYIRVASDGIRLAFEEAVKFCIPVVADVSTGKNYSEAK